MACSTRGEMRNVYKILVGNFKGKFHFVGLVVDGSILLKSILKI